MTQSPKEKADELVEKFKACISYVGQTEKELDEDATECAIQETNDIIKELEQLNKPEYTMFVTSIDPIRAENGYERIGWWQEVKTELEKK